MGPYRQAHPSPNATAREAPHTAVPKTDFAGKFVTAPEDGAGPPRTGGLVIGKVVAVSRIATPTWRVGSGIARIAGVTAVINNSRERRF